jgi:hypothetical protein
VDAAFRPTMTLVDSMASLDMSAMNMRIEFLTDVFVVDRIGNLAALSSISRAFVNLMDIQRIPTLRTRFSMMSDSRKDVTNSKSDLGL